MAKQTQAVTGLLAKKLGQKGQEALNKHKNDETTYGQIELPPGIEGGVAQLVDCRFGEYETGDNKGQLYFYAAGIVVDPTEFTDGDGRVHKVEGQRTSIMEAVCDTPNRGRKTVEEHMTWVLNELRKLGATTAELEDLDNLEAVCAALKEAKPYFNFRTWKGEATAQFPNPRTNHQWIKACEWDGGTADNSDVVDESGAAEEPAKPATKPAAAPPSKKPPVKTATKAPEPEPEPEATTTFTDETPVEELVTAANAGDTDAQQMLNDRALAAGCPEEDVTNAADWEAVAALIEAAGTTAEEGGGEAEWKPEVGEIYQYKVIDPKTKKPVIDAKTKKEKKAEEVEITAVDEAKKLVNLKNLTNTKLVYKAVPWDALESAG